MVGIRTLLLLLLAILSSWASQAVAEEAAASESALLKAAYIYNFAKFTRWEQVPEGDTLRICVLGRDSQAAPLQRLAGKWVGERRIAVSMPHSPAPGEGCQILYVATSESATYRKSLQGLGQQTVLTVSEIPGFAASGGMIELFEEQGRIRFRVNLDALASAGLTLSSRLLKLAEIVSGGTR